MISVQIADLQHSEGTSENSSSKRKSERDPTIGYSCDQKYMMLVEYWDQNTLHLQAVQMNA